MDQVTITTIAKRDDERRYAFEILHLVLGGGMSSRLFHSIREERGLAYAVYSFKMPFADVGAWAVYAGTTPEQTRTVLGLVRDELAAMASDGITSDELKRAQGNLRGGLALSLEDPNSRLVALGIVESERGCPAEAEPHLVQVALSGDGDFAEFRTHAIRALAGIGSPVALDALLAIAAPRRRGLRQSLPGESPELLTALRGLASAWPADPRARAVLEIARASRSKTIREAAA